jgi:hypothetical protein
MIGDIASSIVVGTFVYPSMVNSFRIADPGNDGAKTQEMLRRNYEVTVAARHRKESRAVTNYVCAVLSVQSLSRVLTKR